MAVKRLPPEYFPKSYLGDSKVWMKGKETKENTNLLPKERENYFLKDWNIVVNTPEYPEIHLISLKVGIQGLFLLIGIILLVCSFFFAGISGGKGYFRLFGIFQIMIFSGLLVCNCFGFVFAQMYRVYVSVIVHGFICISVFVLGWVFITIGFGILISNAISDTIFVFHAPLLSSLMWTVPGIILQLMSGLSGILFWVEYQKLKLISFRRLHLKTLKEFQRQSRAASAPLYWKIWTFFCCLYQFRSAPTIDPISTAVTSPFQVELSPFNKLVESGSSTSETNNIRWRWMAPDVNSYELSDHSGIQLEDVEFLANDTYTYDSERKIVKRERNSNEEKCDDDAYTTVSNNGTHVRIKREKKIQIENQSMATNTIDHHNGPYKVPVVMLDDPIKESSIPDVHFVQVEFLENE